MSFYNIEFLFLLILLPLFYIFKNTDDISSLKLSKDMKDKILVNSFSKKTQKVFLLLTFIMMLISLARPVYYKSKNESNEINVDMAIALDISKSMLVKDIHPNRFEFAKNKLSSSLELLSGERVALFAFSNQPFIISPLSNNYEVLKFLINNLNLQNINQAGTDIQKLLKGVDKLIKKDKKPLLIFTDGSENIDFKKEITLAKKLGIKIYIYNIATNLGGVIDEDGILVKDKKDNIVVSKINKKIKDLAFATNGDYLEYSLDKNDLQKFINEIKEEFNKDEQILKDSKNKIELFYLPLFMAFVFFIFSRINIRIKK